ncbi:MAG: hypothetical protein KAU95_02340 [Candidatus Aenigmarchaeota archaeon]|nr:hypothetical protein [Candidatus Aenigmarchaeota archaeon]
MKKVKQKYYLILGFTALLGIILISGCVQRQDSESRNVPSSNERCFKLSIDSMKDDFNIDFNLEKINKFHCAWGGLRLQYEVEGEDIHGRSFYVHYLTGGTAASGADYVENKCLIINNEKIVAIAHAGRNRKEYEASCKFDPTKQIEPESEYIFP